jgi:hypothetical protein
VLTASLKQQRPRLREHDSEGGIKRIDDHFCWLRLAEREESGLKRILQQVQAGPDQSTFDGCWSPLLGHEFDD